jgi:predicted DNA-binding transcriptional regulator YafY
MERLYEYPTDYDFEEVFNRNFGIIKEEAFKVEVKFTGFAASYASERIWSPDQRLQRGHDNVTVTFSASSVPEVVSWVLSFGDEAKLNEPAWLVKELVQKAKKMIRAY